jgi:hypothetical protein
MTKSNKSKSARAQTENVFSPTFGNRPFHIVGRETELSDYMAGLEGNPGHPNRATFFIE